MSPAPIIVTALLGPADFAWADALRRAHFPPERNHLRAHLTLFHHLPPSVEGELTHQLRTLCQAPAPTARLAGIMSLGRGVAYRVDSPELDVVRDQLAAHFELVMTPQDRSNWRAHITVQNKVDQHNARALYARLKLAFAPRPLEIAGLAAWWYRGGPWEPIGAWSFGGGRAVKPPC